jgi:hypothetical protein
MKGLLFAFLVLGPTLAMAKSLVVFADIALLPDSGFTEMAKDPECGKPTESGDLYVICLGGWSRYSLTRVTRLNGVRLEDTIALIYADPVLGGRWRLELQRLDASAAAIYGASYKAISAKRADGTGAQ